MRADPAHTEPTGTRASLIVVTDAPAGAATLLPIARELARLEQAALRIVLAREWPEMARRTSNRALVVASANSGAESGGRGLPTAVDVLGSAPCPVVLVPTGPTASMCARWTPNRILVPHSGAPGRCAGPGVAFELARAARGVVTFARSAGTLESSPPEGMPAPIYVDQPQHEWSAWEREFLARVTWDCPAPEGVAIRAALVPGDSDAELLRFARERGVDLIVLDGSETLRADPWARRMGVFADAPCPTLVTR